MRACAGGRSGCSSRARRVLLMPCARRRMVLSVRVWYPAYRCSHVCLYMLAAHILERKRANSWRVSVPSPSSSAALKRSRSISVCVSWYSVCEPASSSSSGGSSSWSNTASSSLSLPSSLRSNPMYSLRTCGSFGPGIWSSLGDTSSIASSASRILFNRAVSSGFEIWRSAFESMSVKNLSVPGRALLMPSPNCPCT